jgi:hypothetical protein
MSKFEEFLRERQYLLNLTSATLQNYRWDLCGSPISLSALGKQVGRASRWLVRPTSLPVRNKTLQPESLWRHLPRSCCTIASEVRCSRTHPDYLFGWPSGRPTRVWGEDIPTIVGLNWVRRASAPVDVFNKSHL